MAYIKTTVMLPQNLLEKAYKLMPNSLKKEVIERALTEFVQNNQRKNLREIREEIRFDETYIAEYKRLRGSKYQDGEVENDIS
ncbi:MAG: type II toxin-antitoxin system VapB family antitoxin [Turicibacter sp.]|nr:type II toxin-antitoxin system VapB family antitoxin [Turicibacter sp.]